MTFKSMVVTQRGSKTNRALRVLAACCGLLAGFGGIEHGYFEILQGLVLFSVFSRR